MINPAQYADFYQPDFGVPREFVKSREQLEKLSMPELLDYEKKFREFDRINSINPVQGWSLVPWHHVQRNWKKYPITIILGGNRCLRGDTLIFDPIDGTLIPIEARVSEFHVLAWDGQRLVPAKASRPFIKGRSEMIEVRLGARSFACTATHRLMSPDNGWIAAGDLLPGFKLMAPWNEDKVITVTGVSGGDISEVWDITVPQYENYWASGVVHHNSTKSTFLSRLSVWAACTIPGAEIHAYQANSEKSVNEQQKYVWDAIPIGIKNMPTKKGVNHSLTWSQKNGFTDDVCIFPPHSGAKSGGYIKFRNYAQYADDANTAESYRAHMIWADEECPYGLFETLPYRCLDYHGRIFLTFTTIMGWTPLVQKILGRTKTIKTRRAPLLGCDLPVIQEAMFSDQKNMTGPQACIYYFWTEDNIFLDVADIKRKMTGKPREEILARAYGIPTKSATSAFPSFSKDVHVIPHDQLPWIKNPGYKVTRYMAIDPAGSKNWAMLWCAVDQAGVWWIYREWPNDADWAEPGDKIGPAQKGTKMGIKDYVQTILTEEAGEEIYERLIDPRLGAAERQGQDGATTIISDLDEAGMVTIAASGKNIDDGLMAIKGKLAWDETKPRDSLNSPTMFISDQCQNFIFAMSEYTNKPGKDEAVKDFVDLARYLATSGIEYVDASTNPAVTTGGY